MSTLILPAHLRSPATEAEQEGPRAPKRHWDRMMERRGTVMWGYRDLVCLSRIGKVQAEVGGSITDGFVVSALTRQQQKPSDAQVNRIREDFDMGDADIVSVPGSQAVLLVLPVERWRQRIGTPHKLVI